MNPRTSDTDGDGLLDSVELRSGTDPVFYLPGGQSPDENCNAYGTALHAATADTTRPTVPGNTLIVHDWNHTGQTPDRYAGKDGVPSGTFVSDDQTCPWNADSDGRRHHRRQKKINPRPAASASGETDPRLVDSDGDGLPDGTEDANHDGLFDPATETDPTRADTDGDGILDGIEDSGGCMISHVPGAATFECDTATPASGTSADFTPPAACDCNAWQNGTHEANESDPRVARHRCATAFSTASKIKTATATARARSITQRPSPATKAARGAITPTPTRSRTAPKT